MWSFRGLIFPGQCRFYQLVVCTSLMGLHRKALSRMPSLVIKLEDGTPISWAFLGMCSEG